MKFLPLLAFAIVLAEAGGAVAFLIDGKFLIGLILAVGAVASLTVLVAVRRQVKRMTARNPVAYVEREQTFW